MEKLFKRLPLPVKLMLIGIVPLAFTIYLSFHLFQEKSKKVSLLGSYIDRMHLSADLSMLINNLQIERKYSFEYALNKTMQQELLQQRPVTDSVLKLMSVYGESPADFASYTFLKDLTNVRTATDSGFLSANIIMDYYSSTIYRLNTLNALPTGSYVYMQPVYKDLLAQKLLSEMITFLGIMSANIYNCLYTRKFVTETLVGTAGTYRVYKSYDTEFLLKSSPSAIRSYKAIKEKDPLQRTDRYLDTVFKKFSLDTSYTHTEWEKISTAGVDELRQLQQTLLNQVESKVAILYKKEKAAKTRTLILLLVSAVLVAFFVFYTIYIITRSLKELRDVAQQISLGIPASSFPTRSNDVIGGLADSIAAIDHNNKELATAAHAIGKGQFNVPVKPRSENDLLGNAVVDMKTNLEKNTAELTASNKELERFAYVASHDLQEPLRMVSSFLHLLEKKMEGQLDETGKQYISFAVDGADRMKKLIQDLLEYSRVGTNTESTTEVDCNEIMDTVSSMLSLSIRELKATLTVKELPVIRAVHPQVLQLFQNLVGNALKYHSERPLEIEVGCNDKGRMWEFYVKDNGIGIDPKYFDKIFIIFQRLHNKTDYEGTGIGLSICKKIVEKHGGKIRVDSESGQGSTFYFSLPKK
jgi:signal transduction histidine kinase